MGENNPEIRLRNEASLPLFEQAHARRSDPPNSHIAAKSVVNLGRTKDRILSILRSQGPMTDEQLVDYFERFVDFKVSQSGIRTRRRWLVDNGFVCEAGTGKTQSGRNCSIWRIAK